MQPIFGNIIWVSNSIIVLNLIVVYSFIYCIYVYTVVVVTRRRRDDRRFVLFFYLTYVRIFFYVLFFFNF